MMSQHRNSGRRSSFLDLSNCGAILRPRSASTSVLTVTESTPELRSPSDCRRPPATPCTTPCFMNPRLAFTTQFSYDSPIQIITSGGSEVIRPIVKRFRLGPLLCSKKGLLFLTLLTIGVVSILLLNGKEHTLPEERQCDGKDPTAPCHSHEAPSPLKRFLGREHFTWEQPIADEQDGAPVAQEVEEEELEEEVEEEEGAKSVAVEQRTNRPRMLTVKGQYESSAEETNDHETARESSFSEKREISGERSEESEGRDNLSRGDLQRERRAVMSGERRYPGVQMIEEQHSEEQHSEEQHSMRVTSEEALPPTPPQPDGVELYSEREVHSQAYMHGYVHEEHLQGGHETLAKLYIQHRNLERQGYHHEQRIAQEEIEAQKMSRLRHQEELRQEHHPQQHQRKSSPPPPHRRGNHPNPTGAFHHSESGGLDRQHPVWRDHQLHGQKLPRGVNPRRYRIGDL